MSSILLTLYYIFCYCIFSYSLALMVTYLILTIMSKRAQAKMDINMPDDNTIKFLLRGSPLTPAVSVIAPAYNEEVMITECVKSLMQIDYPDYEIIIVNDESTDDTLNILINEYKLIEVPYDIAMKVHSKPIKRVLKSTDERYSKLVVVDKVHGGTKADSSNAGINVCNNKYFVCTDVDCIIEPMALYRMMWYVVNSPVPMIGVGATMLMVNGCTVEDGLVKRAAVSNRPLPMFQQLEYMRSFLISKLGWSSINALPNISGGFGLFDTDVAVKSGGYDPASFAEDVDMLLRMVTYMKNHDLEFNLSLVPQACCWTEGPGTLRQLFRQRVRWGRGLFEIVTNHRKLFFNRHFGPIGALTLPYIFIFEFMAPVLEMMGFIFMLWLTPTGGVNWRSALIVFGMIYLFCLLIASMVIYNDYTIKVADWRSKRMNYFKMMVAAVLEPFVYHPLNTICSNIGYFRHLRNTRAVWTPIKREGFKKQK